MKRSFHCLFLIFLLTVTARAQSVEGVWEGMLKVSSAEVRLVLHLTRDEQEGLKGFIDARGGLFPATAITFSDSTLKFEVRQNGGSYEGKVNAEGTAISGTWTQRTGSSLPLDFRRVQAGAGGYRRARNRFPEARRHSREKYLRLPHPLTGGFRREEVVPGRALPARPG